MKPSEILATITPPLLDDAAQRWGIAGSDTRFLRAVENFVYEFSREGKPCILRLTHSSHRTADQVNAELELIDFFANHQITVARPIPSRGGTLVEKIASADDSYFLASVFEKAPGAKAALTAPFSDQAQLFEDWGALVGSMHAVVPKYRDGKPDRRRHLGIADENLRRAKLHLPDSVASLLPVLHDLLFEVGRLPQTPANYGLLHTDCHHGNFHVDGRTLTLFDFDDTCHHWFAYDVMVPLFHLPIEDRGAKPERDREIATFFLKHFLTGYQTKAPFPREWLDYLPLFLRLRDWQLYIFAWRTWSEEDANAWQPDFIRQRQPLLVARRPSLEFDAKAVQSILR